MGRRHDSRRHESERPQPLDDLRLQRVAARAGRIAGHVHRRGWQARVYVALSDAVQTGPPDRHVPAVRQHDAVAARDVHVAQLDDARATVLLLRILGVERRLAHFAAAARLLSIPQRRRAHRNLEEHLPDKGHLVATCRQQAGRYTTSK